MASHTLLYLIILPAIIGAFTPSRQWHINSGLNYQTFPTDSQPDPANSSNTALKPEWVPMELISILASETSMNVEDFISIYVDGEVYTSCDDEGDDLHECDFFGMYLGEYMQILLFMRQRLDLIAQVCLQARPNGSISHQRHTTVLIKFTSRYGKMFGLLHIPV